MTQAENDRIDWELTLYHEAGHAVAAIVLGMTFDHVRINSVYPGMAGELGGSVLQVGYRQNPPKDSRQAHIVQTLAGSEAERLRLRSLGLCWRTKEGEKLPFNPGSMEDDTRLVVGFLGREPEARELTELRDRATALLQEQWPTVEALVSRLQGDSVLSYAECLECFGTGGSRRRRR